MPDYMGVKAGKVSTNIRPCPNPSFKKNRTAKTVSLYRQILQRSGKLY